MHRTDPGRPEEEPTAPARSEDWRKIGPLLAKRHAAGLPPMAHWAWSPIHTTTEWVCVAFAGNRLDAPIGATHYLRLHDGAVLHVGSACYFYGLFDSHEDVVAAITHFGVDADPERIEHHIHRVLLAARLEELEAKPGD